MMGLSDHQSVFVLDFGSDLAGAAVTVVTAQNWKNTATVIRAKSLRNIGITAAV